MLERFLYYWAKTYTANLQIGEDYDELRKTISIIIVDSEIEQFKDIPKAHTTWQIIEKEYTKEILTPYLQIDIIEMPRAIKEYEKNSGDEVLQWMMFLENPETGEVSKIMEENKDIKEAKEELDKISQDDILRRMALKADLARRDYNQGINDARRKGREEGERKAKLEDAQKMLEKDISIETIIEITGLTKEEILNNKK